ncbi:C40 family peptidase [Lentimicrobium sp. L6]|uniref:C40 family peptidase n=1 Tax=Lentimicrobium sp. L6 TaxID=2735916 RepID=UPI0015573468|nr:C40 family peptidase [Lentimicrobium sp. L6]NPD83394.1 C40 family peptidase [Lentimicrobium sp. L6]
MSFGFCHLSIVPMRKDPSDTSEMISQLLFGDVFEVLEKTTKNWILIRNSYDNYEGYIDPKQQLEMNSEDFLASQENNFVNKEITNITSPFGQQIIPPACSFSGKEMKLNTMVFEAPEDIVEITKPNSEEILKLAMTYLNAPYLWGGKTPFGIDCSGLTQMVYKMAGIKLFRDAAQQATQGEVLNFLEEAKIGDLAFFDNEEGNIIHVGIIISPNEIIHASGQVRIDTLDHQGIFNKEIGEYSHQLRLVKTFL